MANSKLRQAIAAEAARLIFQGKEAEYYTARRKAARWLSRQRVASADIPSNAEIQTELYALAGLFTAERQSAALSEMRQAALELMAAIESFQPRLEGAAVTGPVMSGAQIDLVVRGVRARDVFETLKEAGYRPRVLPAESPEAGPRRRRLRLFHHFPCEVTVIRGGLRRVEAVAGEEIASGDAHDSMPSLTAAELRQLVVASESSGVDIDEAAPATDPDAYHPDAFGVMQMLLAALERVRFDTRSHPEGDALYHSLQVFELGRLERPYDEEFLLACLLHDAGYGVDRRNPAAGIHQALGDLITPRTWFLIEHLPDALEYLATGRIRGSLRKSEDFDELVLLAQCDRGGRMRGAEVATLEEALDYIAGLSTAWDDA